MFFKSLAIAGLLSLGATAAFAETSITATLAKPVSAPIEFIAATAVWHCTDTTCSTSDAPDETLSVSACRAIAKKAGADVSAMSTPDKALSADRLAKCAAK
jgi:hypothetical protein